MQLCDQNFAFMFWKKKENEGVLPWNELTDLKDLEAIDQRSAEKPVVVFKHSTRCSISHAALSRLERASVPEDQQDVEFVYLDLLVHRNISNAIADRYNVWHESPQLLLIHKGKCIYHASHGQIRYDDLMKVVRSLK